MSKYLKEVNLEQSTCLPLLIQLPLKVKMAMFGPHAFAIIKRRHSSFVPKQFGIDLPIAKECIPHITNKVKSKLYFNTEI